MNISVDINLFATLVECLAKQSIIDKQTPEIQEQWAKIFADTHQTANAVLRQPLISSGNGDPRRTETGMGPMLSPNDTPFL